MSGVNITETYLHLQKYNQQTKWRLNPSDKGHMFYGDNRVSGTAPQNFQVLTVSLEMQSIPRDGYNSHTMVVQIMTHEIYEQAQLGHK